MSRQSPSSETKDQSIITDELDRHSLIVLHNNDDPTITARIAIATTSSSASPGLAEQQNQSFCKVEQSKQVYSDDGHLLHICPHANCGGIFFNISDLEDHLINHGKDGPFVCKFEGCNKSFSERDELDRHYQSHTQDKTHSCDSCGKPLKQSDDLRIHTKYCPNPKPGCSKDYPGSKELTPEHTEHSKSDAASCPPTSIDNSDNIEPSPGRADQQVSEEPAKPKNAPGQYQICTCPNYQNKDYKPSVNERGHICHYTGCSVAFKQIWELRHHLKRHYITPTFACGFQGCDKKFFARRNLESHRLIHIDKPYLCPRLGCDRSYRTESSLQEHISRTHSRGTEFECPGCNRIFSKSFNLKRHIKNVHGEQNKYECSTCGGIFRELAELKAHLNDAHHSIKKKRSKNTLSPTTGAERTQNADISNPLVAGPSGMQQATSSVGFQSEGIFHQQAQREELDAVEIRVDSINIVANTPEEQSNSQQKQLEADVICDNSNNIAANMPKEQNNFQKEHTDSDHVFDDSINQVAAMQQRQKNAQQERPDSDNIFDGSINRLANRPEEQNHFQQEHLDSDYNTDDFINQVAAMQQGQNNLQLEQLGADDIMIDFINRVAARPEEQQEQPGDFDIVYCLDEQAQGAVGLVPSEVYRTSDDTPSTILTDLDNFSSTFNQS